VEQLAETRDSTGRPMNQRKDESAENGVDDGKQSGKLRDFSAQLAARLQAPSGPVGEPAQLAIRIGAASFLLNMNSAGEIVTAPPVTPVPWTKPWYLGLANVRGRLIGVIDLMQLAGGQPLAAEDAQQLVVFSEGLKTNAGLLITRAFGLRSVKDLEPLGALKDRARPWEARAFRDADGTRMVELDLQGLTNFDEFNSIGV
jgi:twitching motility protein PilI